jgi:hypothetical protein
VRDHRLFASSTVRNQHISGRFPLRCSGGIFHLRSRHLGHVVRLRLGNARASGMFRLVQDAALLSRV